ncbi:MULTISPECIES: RimK family alpha-L-glutamate ligase [unclassified Natrinema]|uniref:ATP-grasp domain-containing protein n=1 Tax=unclassified Natrinema TaxID=2622230 RepID=UPI00026D47D3|nr:MULTISPECIES: RimK domain-containing protein ATP-grasp [unclassified Natrinema]AFO59122.1 RimK domain-containing protein ATP-grasp [Natrinema sp. J7-2]
MTVLLIGDGDIYEMKSLKRAVEDQGKHVHLCDVTEWPDGPPLTVDPSDSETMLGAAFDYTDVSAVYVHFYELFSPFSRRFRSQLDENFVSTFFQLREYRGLFKGLFRIVENHGAEIVPALEVRSWHDRKPWQIHLFESLDVPTPDTLFTTDSDEVQQFCAKHREVIYKSITNGGLPTRLTEDDLEAEKLDKLSTAPVQFQEFVEGEDLRIYVLDGEVIGAVRYESKNYSFKIDLYEGDEQQLQYHRADVGEDIADDVVRATEAAGLVFAAADIRRRPDGSYALLELNNMPRFAVADTKANYNISDKLAEYLVEAGQPRYP